MDFGSAISLLGIAAGIAVTLYAASKYADRKDPRFFTQYLRRIELPSDIPSDVEITHKGTRVRRVASTFLWFWNQGRRPILSSDVLPREPLLVRLSAKEPIQILDATVVHQSRNPIQFHADKWPSADPAVRLSMEFLDHMDGAIVEIQHTGAEDTAVEVSGVILGANRGARPAGPIRSWILRDNILNPESPLQSFPKAVRHTVIGLAVALLTLALILLLLWLRRPANLGSRPGVLPSTTSLDLPIVQSVSTLRAAMLRAGVPEGTATTVLDELKRSGADRRKPDLIILIGVIAIATLAMYLLLGLSKAALYLAMPKMLRWPREPKPR